MQRAYVGSAIALTIVGVVAALVFGGAAGAKGTRIASCAKPSKVTPTQGGPGTQITVYTKNANKVYGMWLRRKNDNMTGGFGAELTDFTVGHGWVSGVVPSGIVPDIVDGPVELDTANPGGCVVFTEQIFHIEGYK